MIKLIETLRSSHAVIIKYCIPCIVTDQFQAVAMNLSVHIHVVEVAEITSLGIFLARLTCFNNISMPCLSLTNKHILSPTAYFSQFPGESGESI